MIDKLKFLIDQYEDNPKMKDLMLKVAALSEKNQELMLQLIEMMVQAR